MVEIFKPRSTELPKVIVGGMGVNITNANLVRASVRAGEKLKERVLGTVAGTGLAAVMALKLQKGDPDIRRALKAFCVPEIAKEIYEKYSPRSRESFALKLPPKPEVLINGSEEEKAELAKLLVVASFAEIWLAKQGHSGPVGYNVLQKVELPHLWELYGAILGGVDYVLMGAGIPYQIPEILDKLARNEPAEYRLNIGGSKTHEMSFDPRTIIPESCLKKQKRPEFLAIVSHHSIARRLVEKTPGVNGLIVEGPSAGGHNAPPFGKEKLFNDEGEPIYGKRDEPNLDEIRKLGKPLWLAGGYAEKIKEARELGAAGIQVGSIMALCDLSGLRGGIKQEIIERKLEGNLRVKTSATASPTGFPFQVVQLYGTLSEEDVYEKRTRTCLWGYLVEPHQGKNGEIVFRCPAEPVSAYVKKGGEEKDTRGVRCFCEGLINDTDYGKGPAIVTLGKNLDFLPRVSPKGPYSAEKALRFIFSGT